MLRNPAQGDPCPYPEGLGTCSWGETPGAAVSSVADHPPALPPRPQEESEKQLSLTEAQTREALLALLPGLSAPTHQVGGEAALGGPLCGWGHIPPDLEHFCRRITPTGCRSSKRKAQSC